MIRRLMTGSVLLAVLLSCRNEILIDKEFPVELQKWVVEDKKEIEFVVPDTTNIYEMQILISHSKNYGFQNLFVRIITTFPSGKVESSITSLELVDQDGSWVGDCNGNKCSVSLPLQQRFAFPEKGTYKWAIEPYMRMDTVPGIQSIRVLCKKVKG